MPEKLILPMILSGTSEKGICPHCGTPWNRIVDRERVATRPGGDTKTTGDNAVDGNRDPQRHVTKTKTMGWEPGCACTNNKPVPAVVMDPFAGSGTVLAVARERRRRAVGVELNPDYVTLAYKRINNSPPGLL